VIAEQSIRSMLLWDAVREPLRQRETLLRNRNIFNLPQIAKFDPLVISEGCGGGAGT
jgi:hypothetical protein